MPTWTLGCDAEDPHQLASFWADALGYIPEPGYENEHGASIIDPNGDGPAIGFLAVPEAKTAKNRMHIDIRVAEGEDIDPLERELLIRETAATLAKAGATVIAEEHYDNTFSHIVMHDPEGNEFCVA